jgi:hypothetical protein
MPVNQITIITLALVTIILIIGTLSMMRGPKKIEKYMLKINKLNEQYKFYINVNTEEGYRTRKKLVRKHKKAYLILTAKIKFNLIRIMIRNKDLTGNAIISDPSELTLGIARLRIATMAETSESNGTHTINKKHVYLCDANHPNTNTIAHVIIHEFAHVINATVGHDRPWTKLFETLQDIAHKEGWFDRREQLHLHTYCGAKYNI